jgi:hypothetical protein
MAPAPQWLKDIQASSMREDAYAEATDRFGDFDSALRCLVDECWFETPPDPNLHLFDEEEA